MYVLYQVLYINSIAAVGSKFGQLSNGIVWTDRLGCQGNEIDIQGCSDMQVSWGQHTDCDHTMDAGIICGEETFVNDKEMY